VEISNVFDDDELSFLIDQPKPLWAKNAQQKNQREDKFLSSLDIPEWGWKQIYDIFNPQKKSETTLRIEKLVAEHDAVWIMRLYALLNDLPKEYDSWLKNNDRNTWYLKKDYINKKIICSLLKIIRCKKDNQIIFRTRMDSYFKPDGTDTFPLSFNFVDTDVYSIGSHENRKNAALDFLRNAGVRSYDEKLLTE
jgi:hypothetical protein